ncbi:MAG: hypothetical protein CM15mP12_2280 [Gammaproteobacteria bacterium]|nr:MAG: hypothetical protein CM15mP12_2280 [Gammaproteobacteria bacterium]
MSVFTAFPMYAIKIISSSSKLRSKSLRFIFLAEKSLEIFLKLMLLKEQKFLFHLNLLQIQQELYSSYIVLKDVEISETLPAPWVSKMSFESNFSSRIFLMEDKFFP